MRGKDRATAVPAGRLSRLTRLGAMSAGVAGSMAVNGVMQWGRGERPGLRDLLLTPGNMARVTAQLARMRGAAMKIGQLISMDGGDMMPPELADIMGRLRSDAHVMPPKQLKQVLNAQWPRGWPQAFAHFDVHPIAAASIGQVHRARLRDGRDMAIKVQYPGVARSIDSDVANVGALIRMTGLLPAGFELAPYLAEAARQLHEETDYLREARQLADFRAMLKDDPRFDIPRVFADWTTPGILAMSFAPGVPIEELHTAPQAQRNQVTADLIDLLLREIFVFGRMQSDPNFANYLYNPESGRIVLLDFGAARAIDPRIAGLYRALIGAGLNGDAAALRAVAQDLGFIAPETRPDHRDRILRMMALVFAEIAAPGDFDFAGTDLNRRLQEEGAALVVEGFVPPPLPIDILYLQRKIGGVALLATRLRARLPLRDRMAAAID